VEAAERIKEPQPSNGGACFECQQIAHFIQTELYDYNKEKQVDDWLINNVCRRISVTEAQQTCESFVQEYGPSVLQLIAMKAFDPKALCEQELKLCPPSPPVMATDPVPDLTYDMIPEDNREVEASTVSLTESVDHSMESPQVEPKQEFEMIQPENGVKCELCVLLVRQLDELMESGKIGEDISETAAKACSIFKGERKEQCSAMVQTYGPYLLQMIGRLSSPKQVCKSVDLCFIPGQVHLLGGLKCTFGPSYWCRSTAHASACKASEYCQRSFPTIE